MVDTVIPFTVNELPKFFFVASNKKKNHYENSDEFCVLDIEDDDFNSLNKKKTKDNKVIVVVPLG